jgi:hypothetical protein
MISLGNERKKERGQSQDKNPTSGRMAAAAAAAAATARGPNEARNLFQ